MFSGLTNQVSSWMGAAKGEPQDEEVPTPTKDATGAEQSAEGEKLSPTKAAGSKLDIITNVKSQMTGWLGSGIPIPGLRKNEAAAGAGAADAEPAPAEPVVDEPKPEPRDDDDNSSATGGADSRPASAGGTPTDDQPAPVGNGQKKNNTFHLDGIEVPDMTELTTKAVAGAKSLGNFLYSAVNKAGAKVSEASAKIKKTVEENSILGEFNREQSEFIKGQDGRGGATAVPPWVGAYTEDYLKEEIISLSGDRRNFVRAPPTGVEFDFDYDKMYPVAVAIMAEDPELEKMRFELVPKVITEENFWRNYFYRMSLIIEANEADAVRARQPEPEAEDDKSSSESVAKETSQESIDHAKQRIKSLKVDRENKDEENWEEELERQLKEYEVVADKPDAIDDAQLENECRQMLGDDEDLK